ncbi:c-type cytochrome [Desulfonatronovibrio hydrogenovorans]|uniref:c-type cytochrome n=1 Tax=Desulfonatronovibrio hydrogenovorans TaxID=53245 RepID=UPI0012371D09|nr:c-type cytochrome [Desulfonatronovibrio hydrogenovorans]
MKRVLLTSICLVMLGSLFMFGLQDMKLQAGDGQAIMETRCTTCHGAGRIERAGHDLDGWKSTVDRMMGKGNFGPALSDAERQALLKYLVTL